MKKRSPTRARLAIFARQHPDIVKYAALSAAAIFTVVCLATGYYYVTFSRLIDARLIG